MVNRRIQILFLALLPIASIYPTNIKIIKSFEAVKEVLEKTTKKTLVVFDIDETLTMKKDLVLQSRFHMQKCVENFIKGLKKLPEGPLELANSKLILFSERRLVEPIVVDMILNLQKRSITCIALTQTNPGQLGMIPCVQEHRYKELVGFGIDFSSSFPITQFSLTSFSPKYNPYACSFEENESSCYPLYYKGMLLAYVFNKGMVLTEFLKKFQKIFSHIICFDDNNENLKEIDKYLALYDNNIIFEPYLYEGAQNIGGTFDSDVADYQTSFFLAYGQWLSDEKVKKILYEK
jgi:hypothetical protein